MKALIYMAIAAASLLPLTAMADNHQEPVEVEADQLDLDQRAGTAVYTGNVEVRQGNMLLRGDEVEIQRNEEGELSRAIALGDRAYLRQHPEDQETPTEGWGRRVIYHVSERRVELISDAEITQRGDRFTGGRLEYFIDREVVKARSDVENEDSQRIRMTLQPED